MDYLADKLGIAVDWSSQDIQPIINDICDKYIAWEIKTSIVWIIVAIVSIVIAIASIIVLCITGYIDVDDVGFYSIIVTICALSIIGFQIFDIVRCKTFPELQLYEYITNTIIPELK